MKDSRIVETYERHYYEVQQQGGSGDWYRLVSSKLIENGNDQEMAAHAIERARQQVNWSRGLRGFLPEDLIRVGKLRMCRVVRHVDVLALDVKKAMASTKIQSKGVTK